MKNLIPIYRAIHKLTLDECAKKVGMSKNNLFNLEHGFYNPSLISAYKLSLLFGVPMEHLFDFSSVSLSSVEGLEGQVSI